MGQKKCQYLWPFYLFFYFFLNCSFVQHSCRLTSYPVFSWRDGGISATAASIFCHPGRRVLHLGRQERKTGEGHVEWEKEKEKNIRPGRGIIIFPLISSVWRSSHLRERDILVREYSLWYNLLPYEQRKHHYSFTFHCLGQGLSTLSEPGTPHSDSQPTKCPLKIKMEIIIYLCQ